MCVCVCVCVCVNRPRVMFWQGLFKHWLHQQSPSRWYAIAKTSLVHQNKTPRQTRRHTKPKETFVPVYLGMKLHCGCTKHLRKGRTKVRHLKTGPRNIRSSQSFHTGAVCWRWSWAFFSSLNPSELHTSTSSYRHWQSCYHVVVVVLPLTTSTTPDGYQCTFVTYVSTRRHPSMYQAFCNGGFVVHKHMTKHTSSVMRW